MTVATTRTRPHLQASRSDPDRSNRFGGLAQWEIPYTQPLPSPTPISQRIAQCHATGS
jgi:hypothetical protein